MQDRPPRPVLSVSAILEDGTENSVPLPILFHPAECCQGQSRQMGVSNRSAEPGRSDARANRRRVLEAARSAWREQGPDAEVREIAQRAGVGLATIYRGFGNKEGLLAAVAEQVKNDVLDLFSAAEMQAQPAEGLRRFLVDAIGYVEGHGPLFDIVADQLRGQGREP